MENVIDGKKAVEAAASQEPEAEQAAPQEGAQPDEGAGEEQAQPFDKHIIITLDQNGMVSVRSKGICTVEFFGMMHEAERLTKQQIEIKEAMAMEAAMRQQQELEMVRAAIAHPAPQPLRK